MPIQSLIENTRLERPARLADGLELERAPVRPAKAPRLLKSSRGTVRGRNLRPRGLSESRSLVWVPRSRVVRGIRLHRATCYAERKRDRSRSEAHATDRPHEPPSSYVVVSLAAASDWTVGRQDNDHDIGHESDFLPQTAWQTPESSTSCPLYFLSERRRCACTCHSGCWTYGLRRSSSRRRPPSAK